MGRIADAVESSGGMERREESDVLKRYGLAVLLAGLALLVRGMLPVMEGTTVYQLPLAAVIVSAWLGGRGPGYVAAVACWLGIVYWFLPPEYGFSVDERYVVGLSIFSALSVVLVEFSASRWRVERALRESERRLETAQRVAHIGWWERDFAAGRVSLSDESCRIFGVAPVDLPQWHDRWLGLIHPDDRAKAASASEAAVNGGPRYDVEYRVVRPDGTMRVVHSEGDVAWDESGRAVRQFGVMQDVTLLKKAENEARARQELLDLAQEAARAVAFDWFIGARESENRWSPALEALYGLEPGTFDGTYKGWRKLVHPDDWPAVKAAIDRANESGDIKAEYRVIHKDGSEHWLRARGRMFFDSAGRSERMVGFMIDVTDWRHAQDELRASEARFRKLTELSSDWYWKQDENLRFTFAMDDKVGFAPSSLGKARWELPITPLSCSWDEHRAVLAARKPFRDFEYSRPDSHGAMRYISVSGVPMFDEKGNFIGYDGVASDITARKTAEEALRASEARFRTFVDHATDAFFLHDDDRLTVIDANRNACEILGYSREELIGMHPARFDAALDERSIALLAERVKSGESVIFETRHRRKDGSTFPVEVRVRRFEQGGNRFRLSLARDITERKLAEETLRVKDQALDSARAELARVSRLTTLGELTASIAHEVNQPLGAMVANAGACSRWLAAEPPVIDRARQALASIAADGKRASEVIGRIRGLTRRQPPRKDRLDINKKVAEVLALADHELRTNGIVLETQFDEALPLVAGDRVQLQQVMLNLVVNAIDAMSAVDDRPRELKIVSRRQDEGGVAVDVRDTGTGLDPERAERIFEAFYTTKPQGLGIGLSISRSIIEAHGGRLWAAPNAPHGAVFGFSLPVGEEPA
jgi:PAS domain S-box-containing protein